MRKFVKRLFITLIIITLLILGAGWGLLRYAAPERQLDLIYDPIDVEDKLVDMLFRLSPEMVLTESDMNNLAKMMLSQTGGKLEGVEGAEHITITGASFNLEGEDVHALINVLYRDRVAAELKAVYKLSWDTPNLVLTPQKLSLKDLSLPVGLLDTIEVPFELPDMYLIKISDVRFENDKINIRFKLGF